MKLATYEEACEVIRNATPPCDKRPARELAIDDCVGKALADDFLAKDDYPAFDNSAVDGYAIATVADSHAGRMLVLAGETSAGNWPPAAPEAGTAVRVLTGAPVLREIHGVAMQEDVERRGREVYIKSPVPRHANVRLRASDFSKGETLVRRGESLNSGHVGIFASQGASKVKLFAAVRAAVVVSGAELTDVSEQPAPGKLRDSNGPMLMSLMRSAGSEQVAMRRLPDDADEMSASLIALAEAHEAIVVSGGASVGDHDYLSGSVANCGEVLLHGVAVRPGRPFLFGRIGDAFIFGLPGNPASSYVTFEIFVRDALLRLGGHSASERIWTKAHLLDEHAPMPRDDFLRCKGTFDGEKLIARQMHAQGSFGLRSLASANLLVRIPAGKGHVPGDAHDALVC